MPKRKLYVDMDGVLCDFGQHYTNLTGIEWGCEYRTKEDDPEKWTRLEKFPHFFLEMPWMKGAKEFWECLLPWNPIILSASSRSIPNSAVDKREWCRRELGINDDRIIIVGKKKYKKNFCKPFDILIDDHPDNRKDWTEAGGLAIWYKDPVIMLQTLKMVSFTFFLPS